MSQSRRHAFTLVELLVVIGIIALLISILLPSLNKARSAANNVACLSNLKQMGLAVAMYTSANKGSLPFSYYNGDPNWNGHGVAGPFDPVTEGSDWSVLLLHALNGKGSRYVDQAKDSKTRKLFDDTDSIAISEVVGLTLKYSAHPRLMPILPTYDAAVAAGVPGVVTAQSGSFRIPAKITQVRRSAEMVLIMDGAQCGDQEWRALATAWCIDSHHYDGWSIGSPSYLLEASPNANNEQSIDPGPNVDPTSYSGNDAGGSIRWRHLRNTSANFLFVDGHAESRRLNKATPPGGPKGQCDLLKKNVNVVLVYTK